MLWLCLILINIYITLFWILPFVVVLFISIIGTPLSLLLIWLQYKALKYCVNKYNEFSWPEKPK